MYFVKIKFIIKLQKWVIILQNHFGEGIGTSAVKQVCKYVFENTHIIRIFAEPFAYNLGSCLIHVQWCEKGVAIGYSLYIFGSIINVGVCSSKHTSNIF